MKKGYKQSKATVRKRQKTLLAKQMTRIKNLRQDQHQTRERANPKLKNHVHLMYAKVIKKSLMREKEVYCNGKVYN